MTIVTSYDVESETWTHHQGETPARQSFRAAVADIAAKAQATLPECNGRVEKAVAIVLNGDVALLPEGKAKVGSQSNGITQYFVVNGTCECKDFAKAPSGWCKHRIAAGLARRVAARLRAPLDVGTAVQVVPASQPTVVQASPAPPLPEAPVSITLKGLIHGQEVMVTLRGVDFASVQAQVEAASQWLDAKSSPPAEDTHPCPTHGVSMKLNHGKDGRTWYSHKTAEGWCKGK